MSVELSDVNAMNGGGGLLAGLFAGNALNRDEDRGRTSNVVIMAAIIFVIFIIFAIIALMFFGKDKDHKRVDGGGIAEILAATVAAKGIGNDNNYHAYNSGIDKLEIMQKLECGETRAQDRETQREIQDQGKAMMQLGFGLSGQINGNEKTNLENFARVENQLGMQSQALAQILQEQNNQRVVRETISGVIQQLTWGKPCVA